MVKVNLSSAALNSIKDGVKAKKKAEGSYEDFGSLVKKSLMDVNKSQKVSDHLATNLAAGKSENIHETMLSISQAELQFKLMVQVRNKVLEAYQEVMRMNV